MNWNLNLEESLQILADKKTQTTSQFVYNLLVHAKSENGELESLLNSKDISLVKPLLSVYDKILDICVIEGNVNTENCNHTTLSTKMFKLNFLRKDNNSFTMFIIK